MAETSTTPEWMDHANCAGTDPDLFFPGRGEDNRETVAICQECVVRIECLNYALDHGERYGTWGGLSEKQLKLLRRARRTNLHITAL